MEIERKYIIEETPKNIDTFPKASIKQGYISSSPVIRIRQLGEEWILTVKGKGLIEREEFELLINEEEFHTLSKKVEGLVIDKTRYFIPFKDENLNKDFTIELDIFHKEYDGLVLAEVEFSSLDEANAFTPPNWFGKDVSEDPSYQNVTLARKES